MNASLSNDAVVSLDPKMKKSLSMDCLNTAQDSNFKSLQLEQLPSKVQEVQNKIVPQNNLSASPALENGIGGRPSRLEEGLVGDKFSPQKIAKGEVRSTTTWKVVEIGRDRADLHGNKKFKSTCTWKVKDREAEAEIISNGLENGFSCKYGFVRFCRTLWR